LSSHYQIVAAPNFNRTYSSVSVGSFSLGENHHRVPVFAIGVFASFGTRGEESVAPTTSVPTPKDNGPKGDPTDQFILLVHTNLLQLQTATYPTVLKIRVPDLTQVNTTIKLC
jgi:hypothetical protein